MGYLYNGKDLYNFQNDLIKALDQLEGQSKDIKEAASKAFLDDGWKGQAADKYQAYYDLFQNGKDGKIPVGSETKIRIDPASPGRVYGDNKNLLSGPVCGTILFFVAAAVLLILLLI